MDKPHTFEEAGMGVGPYRYCGVVTIPSPSLAEANPQAYNNALAELPRDLSGGCGTCKHCGRPISTVCIVQDAAGLRYGIGIQCVEHVGDSSIGHQAAVDVANLQRRKARAAREAKKAARHEAYMVANKDRFAAEEAAEEAAAKITAQLQEANRMQRYLALGRDITSALDAATDDFHSSLREQLYRYGTLSPRQAEFVAKLVTGKRRGYQENYDVEARIPQGN